MAGKIDYILNILIGSFCGVFLGHGIYVYMDYRKYPDLYAMQSAPWYAGIVVYGVFTLVACAAAITVKFIVRKKKN